MLLDREILEELRLVGNERELPLRQHRLGGKQMTGDGNAPSRWRDDSGDGPERRRLAGTIRPDEAEDLTGRNAEREILDGDEIPVQLCEGVDDDQPRPLTSE
jgi:hypothetical protein